MGWVVCGGDLVAVTTDLPCKLTERAIVILRDLPVLERGRCPEYLIEDEVLSKVGEILARVDSSVEPEIIRYAA